MVMLAYHGDVSDGQLSESYVFSDYWSQFIFEDELGIEDELKF
jgi:hypothetical protein